MPPLAKVFVSAALVTSGLVATSPAEAQSTDGGSTTVVVAAPDPSNDAAVRRPAGTPTKYGTGVRTAKGARFWPGGGGGGVVDVTADAGDGERSRFRMQAAGTPQGGGEGGGAAADGDGQVGVVGGEGVQAAGQAAQAGQSTSTPIDFGSPTYVPGGFGESGSVSVPFNPGGVAPDVTTGRAAAAVPAPRQPVYVERTAPAPRVGVGLVETYIGRSTKGIRAPAARARTSLFGGRGPQPQAEAFGHERRGETVVWPTGEFFQSGGVE